MGLTNRSRVAWWPKPIEAGENEQGDVYEVHDTPAGFFVEWWDKYGEHTESRGPFPSADSAKEAARRG